MKTILCFGDSNTWGYTPASDSERYPPHVRWPGILQASLGADVRVIEEAQNGRTTVLDDPYELICKNGRRALPIALQSHAPLDLVIVMLGTNDLKHYFQRSPHDVAEGVGFLAELVLASDFGPSKSTPQVLLIAPPRINEAPCPFGPKLDGAAEKSSELSAAYRSVAETIGVSFFDAAAIIQCPPTDCIHMDDSGHKLLGEALAREVATLIS